MDTSPADTNCPQYRVHHNRLGQSSRFFGSKISFIFSCFFAFDLYHDICLLIINALILTFSATLKTLTTPGIVWLITSYLQTHLSFQSRPGNEVSMRGPIYGPPVLSFLEPSIAVYISFINRTSRIHNPLFHFFAFQELVQHLYGQAAFSVRILSHARKQLTADEFVFNN